MKKNVMMRLASFLLVAVLISTSAISGTYAKYVTQGTGKDQGRVAKWGVVVTGSADMFKTEYAKDDTSFTVDTRTVVSADTIDGRNKLLAPGTKGGLTDVALSGTPEVAVRVTHDATFDIGNWILDATTYYCPIVITVEGTKYCGLNYTSEAEFEAAVTAAIEGISKDYAANTNLASVGTDAPTVTWEWAFDADDHNAFACAPHGTLNSDAVDANDTVLGNQAAQGNPGFIDLTVVTTVTQID